MGKSIDKHEMIADYLDEMKTDAAAIRALAVHGAFQEELAQKCWLISEHATSLSQVERKQMRKEADRRKRSARRATPLLKYLGAEKAVEIARRALQIHGGVGYTKKLSGSVAFVVDFSLLAGIAVTSSFGSVAPGSSR